MDWITILAILGIAIGAGVLFGAGCSIGRGYAKTELNYERHQRLVERVHRERLEKDKAELQRRLTESRRDYYELSSKLVQSEPSVSSNVVPLPRAEQATEPGAA